jgi:hypothetical protein
MALSRLMVNIHIIGGLLVLTEQFSASLNLSFNLKKGNRANLRYSRFINNPAWSRSRNGADNKAAGVGSFYTSSFFFFFFFFGLYA